MWRWTPGQVRLRGRVRLCGGVRLCGRVWLCGRVRLCGLPSILDWWREGGQAGECARGGSGEARGGVQCSTRRGGQVAT